MITKWFKRYFNYEIYMKIEVVKYGKFLLITCELM